MAARKKSRADKAASLAARATASFKNAVEDLDEASLLLDQEVVERGNLAADLRRQAVEEEARAEELRAEGERNDRIRQRLAALVE